MEERPRETKLHLERLVRERTMKLIAEQENLKAEIAGHQRTREMLRESENRYRSIFESTGTAMILVNDDMTIAGVNSEFERQSGFDRREIEGRKTWMEFIAPADVRRMKTYHQRRRIDPASAPPS